MLIKVYFDFKMIRIKHKICLHHTSSREWTFLFNGNHAKLLLTRTPISSVPSNKKLAIAVRKTS